MERMTEQNLRNIKTIFQQQTGVDLSPARRRPVRLAVLVAAAIVCLVAATGFAVVKFSDLAGDTLGFSSAYQGNGVVSIAVENRSDRVLRFQEKLKLMRWSTGEEILPIADAVAFAGTEIAPHSEDTMTVDLSMAYDMAALEKPLTDDHYYFVLTNNNFVFGQDWMCSVEFAPAAVTAPEYAPEPGADKAVIEGIEEALRFYFESSTLEPADRRERMAEYVAAYEKLLADFEGTIVPSVEASELTVEADLPEGVLPEALTLEQRRELVGLHRFSMDRSFKLLATQGETALTISAVVPEAKSDALPLFYLLTYEKAAVCDEAYAFIYGQLVPFAELEKCKVYEDDRYVCYEVSPYIYSDLQTYWQGFAEGRVDAAGEAEAFARVEAIYDYFADHLPALFYDR